MQTYAHQLPHILFVSSDRDLCSLMQTYFCAGSRCAGFDCVHSLAQAEKAVQAKRYDVLVTELYLNNCSSFELLDRLLSQPLIRPGHILVCTDNLQQLIFGFLAKYSVSLVILKPYSARMLCERIQRLIEDVRQIPSCDLVLWLVRQGLSRQHLGLMYLSACVRMRMDRPSVTLRQMYAVIAEKHHTSASGVDNALRALLQQSRDTALLQELDKPTVSSLLRLIIERRTEWEMPQ